MNQLEERLRTAGGSHTGASPDLNAIMDRGRAIRRRRQVAATMASLVLIAGVGAVAFNLIRPSSDATAVSATDGLLPDGASTDDVAPADRDDDGDTQDGSSDNGVTTSAPPTGAAAEDATESDEDGSGREGEGDGGDGPADPSMAPPSSSSLSDAAGGWLTAEAGGLRHLRADGTEDVISMPEPPGGFAQRWPSDVVNLAGRRYLLIDQFVNRVDLAEQRTRDLAERYGVVHDPEGGSEGQLYDLATPRELGELDHFEVAIIALDLESHEWNVVENRVITSAMSPDWIYNGHITVRNDVILVMRELWQGACMYVEGLTLDGERVVVPESNLFPKPAGIDDLTFEDIDAIFAGRQEYPQPCHGLDEVDDGGQSFLGHQADPAQLREFGISFFEAGLG